MQDTLQTHANASLYEAFSPAEGRRLVERVEWHETPQQGSWLHMAASALAHLATQCLDRRIPDWDTLAREVTAWHTPRHRYHTKANW